MQLYTYGDSTWKDLLTAVNGQTISYDAGGNPVSYLGHTLTWQKGRQLKSFDTNTYNYNANGIRTSKTVGGVTHTYILEGTNIIRENWGNNSIVPCYDNEGAVCGIIYNDTPYYFVKNLQGDVIAITDTTGAAVARYSYDAWGVPTTVSDTTEIGIADINPYRYRSYYYDSEIGMYYLQSRYYDPALSRFINADDASYASTQGHNLFAYCRNDPTMKDDKYGFCSSYGRIEDDPEFLGCGFQVLVCISFPGTTEFVTGLEIVWFENYISSSPVMYIYCSNFQHASFFDIGSFVSERDVLNSPNVSSRYISDYFEGYKYRPSVNICVTGILVYGTNFNNKNDYIKPKRLTIKSLSILTTTEIRSSDNKLEIYSAGFNFNLYSFGSSSYSLGRYAQFIKSVPSKFGNKEKNKVERSIGM